MDLNKKIFLSDTSNGLNIPLKGSRSLLPTGEYYGEVSAYDQYIDERKNSNIIRLTCQVNTICSNVLFNRISEIVRDEGSDKVTFINYGVLNGVKQEEGSEESVVREGQKIYYKPTTIDFWQHDSINYVTNVLSISSMSPDEEISGHDIRDIGVNDMDISHTRKLFHPTNAIRDTQLSNDEYVYHCGLDFFNNHLVRSNSFKTICKFSDDIDEELFNSEETGYTAFNTIADLMRDINGNCVIERLSFPIDSGIPGNVKTTALHLYTYDDVDTFEESIRNKQIEKYNGWLGFYNKSKIKSYDVFTPSEEEEKSETIELPIDKPLMYMNGGDFIDLYPGHELYSFVPLYNKYKNRFENNWNYCITYPRTSTTDGFEDIIETNNNSLKAIYFDENTRADNGTSQLVIYGIAKHGLKVGDYVNIYNTYNDVTALIISNAEVSQIADDFIFTVYSDIRISDTWVEVNNDETIEVNGKTYNRHPSVNSIYLDEDFNKYYVINDKYINLDKTAQHISYKKVVNGVECEYYVRVFTRVPNFKFASGDTSSEYEITKNDKDGFNMIDKYSSYDYEFESTVSRLAFAKNVYSDDVGEIVFTDNIDVSNLKDNLGRPLTKLYLTIIKNNNGYKEWYGFDYNNWSESAITSNNVEFSHCFGKITCGLETSDESTNEDEINSIKKLSNIGLTYGYDNSIINNERSYGNNDISITPNEISYKYDNSFYGDLCYYDYFNAVETSIQPILHRFNTAQRECRDAASSFYFKQFNYDEIKRDDYDTDFRFLINVKTVNQCNEKEEGYYYIPHYEIPIRSFGKLQYMLPDLLDIRSITSINDKVKRIHCLQYHHLSPGDKALLYSTNTNHYYFLTAVKNDDTSDNVFYCTVNDENGDESAYKIADININDSNVEDDDNYKLFKLDNMNIPDYATLLKDGTCRYIWRNVYNNGIDGGDKSFEELPFTNGAFYINKRIDLYLRRQDPYGVYGLYSDDDIFGNEMLIEDENNYIEEKDITC
jgi:hypothetical protein